MGILVTCGVPPGLSKRVPHFLNQPCEQVGFLLVSLQDQPKDGYPQKAGAGSAQVMETESYVRELLGNAKRKEPVV